MKSPASVAMMLGLWCVSACTLQALANPIDDVLGLMDGMVAKVQKDAEAEAKTYGKFMDWCDETARNSAFAVESAQKKKKHLEAKLLKLTSDIELAGTKVEELASAIAEAEGETKKAKGMRAKESADFITGEKELMDMVDALARAVKVLENKGSAALAQVDTTSMQTMVQALSTMLDAASFPTSDRTKLIALVQSKNAAQSADADAESGAPSAAAYESKSGSIVEILEDMREEAETQLSKLRKAETQAQHEYDMLKQSLENRLAADNKEMAAHKKNSAKSTEDKAGAEGDLERATNNLNDCEQDLKTARSTCLKQAADHEQTVAARKEELGVLAKAMSVLKETANGGAPGFLQTESAGFPKSRVVLAVQRLSKKEHSAALAQLSSRISAAIRMAASSGGNPFAKIAGLINDMIAKLQKRANNEATEKAYCDKEMAKTDDKEDDLQDEVGDQSATIDSSASKIGGLTADVNELNGELASMAKEQADMDKIRAEEHYDYGMEKDDLKLALSAVGRALTVLKDYYGGDDAAAALLQEGNEEQQPPVPEKHTKSSGVGNAVITLLETIKSDLAQNLAKSEAQEEGAQSDYEKVTGENQVSEASKEGEVKHDSKSIKRTENRLAQTESDRDTTSSELNAVEEYEAKLKEKCIAKPSSFKEEQRRLQAEIAGLKEALHILSTEAASLVQLGSRHTRAGGALRGLRRSASLAL